MVFCQMSSRGKRFEPPNLGFAPQKIVNMNSRKMRWVGYVARMG
jgi:hypothetical protein